MTIDPLVLLSAIGTLLTAVVTAGLRKLWVWGWVLTDMEEDRDFWRALALKSMGTTDVAIAKVPKPDA